MEASSMSFPIVDRHGGSAALPNLYLDGRIQFHIIQNGLAAEAERIRHRLTTHAARRTRSAGGERRPAGYD